MSTRFASGPCALASLVRESQDLAAAWRDKDKALLDALSNPEIGLDVPVQLQQRADEVIE